MVFQVQVYCTCCIYLLSTYLGTKLKKCYMNRQINKQIKLPKCIIMLRWSYLLRSAYNNAIFYRNIYCFVFWSFSQLHPKNNSRCFILGENVGQHLFLSSSSILNWLKIPFFLPDQDYVGVSLDYIMTDSSVCSAK